MDETEWLNTTDLRAMVLGVVGTVGMRKARLFAVACCRRIWSAFKDDRGREAVEFVERLADGLVGQAGQPEVLRRTYEATSRWREDPEAQLRPGYFADVAACWAVRSHPDHVMGAAWHCATAVGRRALAAAGEGTTPRAVREAAEEQEFNWQRHVLRDIVGNPFRSRPPVEVAWLAWNDGTVRKLAEVIYEERAFEQMPLLADALEDAGCTDADILSHCREQGGVHVRGCWVVDLLLGRE